MKITFLALALLFSSLAVAESNPWTETNKAEIQAGRILKNNKVIFKLDRQGNSVQIKVPKAPRVWDSSLWIFEVNYQGQYQTAKWDNKTKSWIAHLMGKGMHTIYVSQRMSNVQKRPYAWFVLSI